MNLTKLTTKVNESGSLWFHASHTKHWRVLPDTIEVQGDVVAWVEYNSFEERYGVVACSTETWRPAYVNADTKLTSAYIARETKLRYLEGRAS